MKTDIAQILSLAKDVYLWGNHSSGLENSTRPLVFTSASGCRASGIMIFLMKITIFPIYSTFFVMQGKCLF